MDSLSPGFWFAVICAEWEKSLKNTDVTVVGETWARFILSFSHILSSQFHWAQKNKKKPVFHDESPLK